MQQDNWEYTYIVCSLNWDSMEFILFYFFLSLLGFHNTLVEGYIYIRLVIVFPREQVFS